MSLYLNLAFSPNPYMFDELISLGRDMRMKGGEGRIDQSAPNLTTTPWAGPYSWFLKINQNANKVYKWQFVNTARTV